MSTAWRKASFDAWTRYHLPDENSANATVSYYTKGSLVALALFELAATVTPSMDPQPTLDGVMLKKWQLARPITHADIAPSIGR